MNLAQLLLTHHANALAAADHRDRTEKQAAIEKTAAKMPGAAAKLFSNIGKKVTNAFKPTQAERAQKLVGDSLSQMMLGLNNALASGAKPDPDRLKGVQTVTDLYKTLSEANKKSPGKAIAGFAGVLALGAGAEKAIDNWRHHENLVAIQKDKEIPASHRVRAVEVYNTLARYAPSIAKDPTFARDFTRLLIRHDAIDHKTVSDLINAEKMFHEAKGKRNEFLAGLASTGFKAMVG